MMTFEDSKGKTWTVRVDCYAVMKYENSTGHGIFEAVMDAVASENPTRKKHKHRNVNEKADLAKAARLGKKLFGKIGSMLTFLYYSCFDEQDQRASVAFAFEDFCKRIHSDTVSSAIHVALISLLRFFPELSDVDKKKLERESQEAAPDGPLADRRDPGTGRTSSPSPGSQE